jgi:hypothetical protein
MPLRMVPLRILLAIHLKFTAINGINDITHSLEKVMVKECVNLTDPAYFTIE